MITAAEVTDLLRLLANLDARTIGKDDIALWHAALGQDRVTSSEARQAVIEQVRAEPGVRVNVGHVISRVRDRRRLRRASTGAGMALQEALRAIPAEAPDYQARVMNLLREPVPPTGAGERVAALDAGPAAAAERARRGRALVEAALAERRKATGNTPPAAASRDSGAREAAASHVPRARAGDPQALTRTVTEAARILGSRRSRENAE